MKRDLRYWVRLLSVGLIGGILLACIVIELIYIISITQPAPSTIENPPQITEDIIFQPVSLFNEQDNIYLSGWYIPSNNQAAIILLHGFGGNRLDMRSRAEVLARHGYGVLLYDLRGHGTSQGDIRAFGWEDVKDVHTALEFLSNREDVNADRIGILGFSIGGQIAIRATAEYEQIKAIIADDPGFVTVDDAPKPTNTKQRIMYLVSWIDGRCVSLWTGIPIPPGVTDVMGDISPRPIMFIDTGQGDGRVLVRYFFEVADEPKELWEIPETFHGNQFNARPLEYEEKMITFFNDTLLGK
ncbi:MAG: alpha/beta fold hydrolase [Anaerolineaceae bacterium]|nr:alpha/beta fold hydrolase [Anaerolineaceae bacterium]